MPKINQIINGNAINNGNIAPKPANNMTNNSPLSSDPQNQTSHTFTVIIIALLLLIFAVTCYWFITKKQEKNEREKALLRNLQKEAALINEQAVNPEPAAAVATPPAEPVQPIIQPPASIKTSVEVVEPILVATTTEVNIPAEATATENNLIATSTPEAVMPSALEELTATTTPAAATTTTAQ